MTEDSRRNAAGRKPVCVIDHPCGVQGRPVSAVNFGLTLDLYSTLGQLREQFGGPRYNVGARTSLIPQRGWTPPAASLTETNIYSVS